MAEPLPSYSLVECLREVEWVSLASLTWNYPGLVRPLSEWPRVAVVLVSGLVEEFAPQQEKLGYPFIAAELSLGFVVGHHGHPREKVEWSPARSSLFNATPISNLTPRSAGTSPCTAVTTASSDSTTSYPTSVSGSLQGPGVTRATEGNGMHASPSGATPTPTYVALTTV